MGLKSDCHVHKFFCLILYQHAITQKKALDYADKIGAEYWQCSSKTGSYLICDQYHAGENVEELFSRIATVLFEKSLIKELDREEETQVATNARYSFHVGTIF